MEGSKSFSIDALLAREPPVKRPSVSPVSSPPPHASPPASPDSRKSPRSFSPASADGSLSMSPGHGGDSPRGGSLGGSPPMSLGVHHAHGPGSGLLPRPGLLSGTSGGSQGGQPHHSMFHGMFPGGHPLYTYNGHPMGQPSYQAMSMLNGSAFHLPPDQAFKAAQLHGLPVDWFARAGMLMPRPMDYTGESDLSHYKPAPM